MSQPVKLSDSLVTDARVAGKALQRSIAGQVEFWARLGRAVEPLLRGDDVLALSHQGARPLSECLRTAATQQGMAQLQNHLRSQPFPHYEADPDSSGMLIRIDESGTRTWGRFVNRRFVPAENR